MIKFKNRRTASSSLITDHRLLITYFCLLFTIHSFAQQPLYLDASQPVDKRVEDLLSRMTLEEKVGQINMPCVYMLGRDVPAKNISIQKHVEGTLLGTGPGGGFFTLANEVFTRRDPPAG